MTGSKLVYRILQFAMNLRELVIRKNLKTNKITIQKTFVGKRKLETYKIAIQKICRKKKA